MGGGGNLAQAITLASTITFQPTTPTNQRLAKPTSRAAVSHESSMDCYLADLNTVFG